MKRLPLLLATALISACPLTQAGPASIHQPEITGDDLAWLSDLQYVKGSIDGADSEKPHNLRLILQKQGSKDVVLLPTMSIPYPDNEPELKTDFLFTSAKQPDGKLKLFIGTSNEMGRAHFSNFTEAFTQCKIVCVQYLDHYKLTKGRHVLLYGDGGNGAADPASEDFSVRVILEVE